jgi:hypothetical protein
MGLRMSRRNRLARAMRAAGAAGAFAGIVISATPRPARAQDATLGADDFTLVLSRIDSASGDFTPLDDDARDAFFSASRCACPTSAGVTLALTSEGAAKLAGDDDLDATVMIGSDCDNVNATACPSLGSTLTLTATRTATDETLSTGDVFAALAPGASCASLPATSSRLWAIVRLNGARLESQPSVTISLGGAGPQPPTAVTAQTADGGLLVSWSAPAASSSLQGYQVLCSPGPSDPPPAAFDICEDAPSGGVMGPFASLDGALICSGLISAGTHSARVFGLQNGSTYQVAVVSVGGDGTASAPSASAEATPGPTLGFDDLYKEAGGAGLAGCAVAGGWRNDGRGSIALVVGLALVWNLGRGRVRPRRRRAGTWALLHSIGLGTLISLHATTAGAGEGDISGWRPTALARGDPSSRGESPRTWTLELRFGPYYPDVDSELADRGQSARPFEQVFSSKKRLMAGLEIDRQLSHRGGTWAIGFGVGYYKATASALAVDHVTRTGDQTSLRIIPLSLAAVYRADLLRTRLGSPLVPYAKLGLGCALWSVDDTASSASISGQTLGWNAAAGVSLDLSFIDPGAAHTMDTETGVNQIAIFFELAHSALDGFGSSSVLRVGDTTWVGGLMLEM